MKTELTPDDFKWLTDFLYWAKYDTAEQYLMMCEYVQVFDRMANYMCHDDVIEIDDELQCVTLRHG